ncbi:MAG TPA: hypothetical protein VIK81_04725 [Patescibacteria group bacterium]
MTQESFREKLSLTEPTLNWYGAIGFHQDNEGIRIVAVGTSDFINLEDGKVARLMLEWGHSVNADGNLRSAVSEETISEIEAFITKTTGFSPRQIRDYAHKLTELYKGKQAAPFVINWVG